MSYYDDDEVDVRISRHRDSPPSPRRVPVRSYYAAGPAYLAAERTVATTTRTRARSRERSRERRSSPPPVIINNYNTQHEEEEEAGYGQVVHRPSHGQSRAGSSDYISREEYELEKARRELQQLRLRQSRAEEELDQHIRRKDREEWELAIARRDLEASRAEEEERELRLRTQEEAEMARAKRELDAIKMAKEREQADRMREKEYKSQAELDRAKRELSEIRRREERALEEKRIKKELELKALEEQKRAQEEQEERERLEEETIERYKAKELARKAKEEAERAEKEHEYKKRLQEDLLRSGLDENDIKAIMERKSIKDKHDKKSKTDVAIEIVQQQPPSERPTYTRMARRHLSVETLNVYHVDFELDPDPNYILVKHFVPGEERELWWRHTKAIRENRKLTIKVEDDRGRHRHNHLEPQFEWVRKKEHRRSRSKSPGLLMYLAGAK